MGMCGAYGKMPSLGDFFRIGLPRSFCEPWDKWVQSLLISSRAALGIAWEERYMSAPIWRFALAAGMAGPQAVRGVLMPSVDRVGRAFPLTLMCGGAAFEALEDIALAALEDDMTKDRLAQALAALDQNGEGKTPPKGAEWSAVLADETLSFTTSELPQGVSASRLFDPSVSEIRA